MRLAALAMGIALVTAACVGETGSSTTTAGEPSTTQATLTTEPAPTTTLPTPSTTAGGEGGGEAGIMIANFSFSGPATVPLGTTVTVTNNDTVSHTWTSDDDVFDSEALATGDNFEFTFDEPGEYSFFCRFHPGQMMGTITVEG